MAVKHSSKVGVFDQSVVWDWGIVDWLIGWYDVKHSA